VPELLLAGRIVLSTSRRVVLLLAVPVELALRLATAVVSVLAATFIVAGVSGLAVVLGGADCGVAGGLGAMLTGASAAAVLRGESASLVAMLSGTSVAAVLLGALDLLAEACVTGGEEECEGSAGSEDIAGWPRALGSGTVDCEGSFADCGGGFS